MRRLILVGPRGLMEVLGSVARCSPNPRRNTSKVFFEALRSGNKAETYFRSISTRCGCGAGSGHKAETRWRQVSTPECGIFNGLRVMRCQESRFSRA